MYNNFSFKVLDKGTAEQRISFQGEGEAEILIPIPNMELPSEPEPLFRKIYHVLVDEGLVPDETPRLVM